MENISPTLNFCCLLVRNIESSRPILFSVREYIKLNDDELSEYLTSLESAKGLQKAMPGMKASFSLHRKSLLELLWSGLNGESIHPSLVTLRGSIFEECKLEIEKHISKLPFLLLIPLMFLQVPAFLILLFGPVLQEFMRSL